MLKKRDWIPYLDDPLQSIRLAAIQGLGKQLDTEVMDIFAEHLEDPSPKNRREIAAILGEKKLAEKERATQILQRLAMDDNLEVKLISLVSQFRLGITGLVKEVASIVPNLEKKDNETILKYLQEEGVFAQLVGTLKQSHQTLERKEAIEFLAALDLPNYTDEIALSLKDPASEVRIAAIEALRQIDDPAILQAFDSLADDPVEAVRLAAKQSKPRIVK